MNILVVGAGGQIGSELVPHLQSLYGEDNIIAADLKRENVDRLKLFSRAVELDALNFDNYREIVEKYKIERIYNLVALLSATGERDPLFAWNVNMGALINSLELAKANNCSLFTPSSIAAFGSSTPHINTPQDTVMRPSTIYGVCKVSGELLSDYYYTRFGVDTRSVRFPGIISSVTLPGGGTTDYAVEVFYEVVKTGEYSCPIPEECSMDMLYMPDALEACTQLMEADPSKLKHRNSFNVTAMSFSPKELFAEIKKIIPEAKFKYELDALKCDIATSWPDSIDDSAAREEWGWNPKWDLTSMTEDMIRAVRAKVL